MKTSRRDFLKISTIGIGGILSASTYPARRLQDVMLESDKIPTYCEVCFWKCAAWVNMDKNGSPHTLIGNNEDPLCNGRLCPRGTAGIGMYEDPDRLTTPLIRREEGGRQYYQEASWPEAIDFIASKMRGIMETDGPEALALFSHGSGGKHFARLFGALGCGNTTAPSYAQCRGPREVGFEATFGVGPGSPEPLDIKNTNCLVLIGSHLGENMHNSQVQEMAELIDRKGTIITVDPRLSTAAAHSTYWLPIKPATDMALLLAWMNVLIEEDLCDNQYLNQYAFGFDELKDHVELYTPEWASAITGISEEDIRATAREMGKASPSVIVHPGRHVTWYGDDTQRTRAIAILNALLGSWGRKGGFFVPDSAKIPTYPHPGFPKPKWTWKDLTDGNYPLARTSISNVLIDASLKESVSGKRIKGWFVVGTNLIHTIPDQNKTIEAIQNLDLLVVVDTMPTEITGYADVVLPECTYLERYDDLRASTYRDPTIAIRKPALKPKGLSKPGYWMTRKLGRKFGLQGYFNYVDYDDVLRWQCRQMGLSYAELEENGLLFTENSHSLYLDDSEGYAFKTNTGLIELYATALEDEGFDVFPEYTEHPQAPEGYFRLNYGRAPMHTFSRTTNNRYLNDLYSENPLWVNPIVANKLSLKNGDLVKLENDQGVLSTTSTKVRVTARIGEDSVYMVHGFGHTDKRLRRTYAKGISDTELMNTVMIDPIMGGTGMRGNFVKIVKTNRKGIFS